MQFYGVSAVDVHHKNIDTIVRTRQTILLHFLHSPTISRAQGPILPLVIRSVFFKRNIRAADDAWAFWSRSPLSSGNSFWQRSVSALSIFRYWSKFARNWRHVRERSWSVLRSSRLASCETMLMTLSESVCSNVIVK